MTRYLLRSQRTGRVDLDLEANLNEQQRAVVLASPGKVLVIAGAGSGKTRTLTYRAAHLLSSGLPPDRILLCTFTNRAAREMVRRVEQTLNLDLKPLWAGTFHHVANLALRRHAERVGLPHNYAILDREDARDLMSACLAEQGPLLRSRRFPKPALLQHILSRAVDSQIGLAEAVQAQSPRFVDVTDDIQRVIDRFVQRKLRQGLVDYDDLLLFFKILLSEHPAQASELCERFEHVLVDEYQDTSLLQGQIIDLCASHHGNLTVVGDDAQSIYSFRGANFRNIIEFPKRYPDAQVFKLETNYRSSPQILNLANASIARNKHQFPKVLSAVRPPSMVPAHIPLRDVYQQAEFVAQRVLELSQEEEVPLNQIAVLYRAHAHSLELQVELTRRDIPFVVRSGLRFFEQAHIKDITAYLRLAHNSGDQLAWHRVLRLWPGVGAKSTSRILETVQESEQHEPSDTLLSSEHVQKRLPASARPSIKRLSRLIRQLCGWDNVQRMILSVMDAHYADYAESAFANVETRLEDLKQFAEFAARYDGLEHFLSDLALVAGMAAEGISPGEPPEEKMTLSTIHQAKGLEWHAVFILWLADGRFPQAISLRTPEEEEEERRLFHVATTRAMDQLYLCHPQVEEPHEGPRRMLRPSRFLTELDGGALPYERWTIEEAPIEETD
jgi:DNA helicase-2/ATP-dependent DNA helicase PcrA